MEGKPKVDEHGLTEYHHECNRRGMAAVAKMLANPLTAEQQIAQIARLQKQQEAARRKEWLDGCTFQLMSEPKLRLCLLESHPKF